MGGKMKKVIVNGKEYFQQDEADIEKLPSMTYPKDLLSKYEFSGFCPKCINEKIACVCLNDGKD